MNREAPTYPVCPDCLTVHPPHDEPDPIPTEQLTAAEWWVDVLGLAVILALVLATLIMGAVEIVR